METTIEMLADIQYVLLNRPMPMMLSILVLVFYLLSLVICIAQFYSSEYGMQLIDLIKCMSVTTILPMNSISYFVLH